MDYEIVYLKDKVKELEERLKGLDKFYADIVKEIWDYLTSLEKRIEKLEKGG